MSGVVILVVCALVLMLGFIIGDYMIVDENAPEKKLGQVKYFIYLYAIVACVLLPIIAYNMGGSDGRNVDIDQAKIMHQNVSEYIHQSETMTPDLMEKIHEYNTLAEREPQKLKRIDYQLACDWIAKNEELREQSKLEYERKKEEREKAETGTVESGIQKSETTDDTVIYIKIPK